MASLLLVWTKAARASVPSQSKHRHPDLNFRPTPGSQAEHNGLAEW